MSEADKCVVCSVAHATLSLSRSKLGVSSVRSSRVISAVEGYQSLTVLMYDCIGTIPSFKVYETEHRYVRLLIDKQTHRCLTAVVLDLTVLRSLISVLSRRDIHKLFPNVLPASTAFSGPYRGSDVFLIR